MISDTTNELERATQFCKAMTTAADLLASLSPGGVVVALRSDAVEKQMDRLSESRKKWADVFREIADDFEKQSSRLGAERDTAIQLLGLARSAVQVFNGKEFKESLENIEKFAVLIERLQKLHENGFIKEVLVSLQSV